MTLQTTAYFARVLRTLYRVAVINELGVADRRTGHSFVSVNSPNDTQLARCYQF